MTKPAEQETARIEIKSLSKSFATPVLKDVNLSISKGSIHGLVGENGAGKSTLINIINGLLPMDSGELFLDGHRYRVSKMRDAMRAGLSLAAQELSLIENLSIAENISLKSFPKGIVLLDYASIKQRSEELQKLVGLTEVEPHTLVNKLSLAQKQLVELAKALSANARLLILDEPTAALTGPQADQLHRIIRERAHQGTSVIYVSHRLDDVLAVCDTVSVLRNGVIVHTGPSNTLTSQMLIKHMSGNSLLTHEHDKERAVGKPCLIVKKLTTADLPNPIDLTCHQGEILGIAGLAGAGRSELLEAIFALTDKTSGEVSVITPNACNTIETPQQAVKLGVGFLAEDRKTQGIFAGHTIAMNTTIAKLNRVSNRWGKLSDLVEKLQVDGLIKSLNVKCDSADQTIDKLSGGNQQKLLIGRWIHAEAKILLLDEPTRGVDVSAKFSIHEQLRELRDSGATMLVVSSELEELTALCDRIIVLSNRKHVASFKRGNWSHDDILAAAFSEYTNEKIANEKITNEK
ncbi:MAG: sugar ABC transporter ATP-binding protein [Colwellia sp.]|nr:sugar ABC transporter ATP-binding protein [Colwellia sp.]